MIKACIITLNDDPTLEWTISSLIGYVDEIIAIDGPWANYSNDLGSTDGTLPILEKYGVNIIEGRWKTEVDKRNAYVNACNTNDWILVIDADEILINGYFLTHLDNYSFPVWSVNLFSIDYPDDLYIGMKKGSFLVSDFTQNRLFKKFNKTHYWKKHYYIFQDGFNITWLHYAPEAEIGIIHIHFLRPYVRKENKLNFYLKAMNLKKEGRGHFSYWLFDDCWRNCIAFQKDKNKRIDYDCVSYKDNLCRAYPGNTDIRGNKQIGPLIL
ncbi:MAG: hypothetical protein HeimC3_41070 [Candidatus Heimdallarchaeota archaeon LC_3]|nr:MAG: hypothetical protein HeimC3_41070 [Candidatus Heimdallarchaeota archaeon LC_3]